MTRPLIKNFVKSSSLPIFPIIEGRMPWEATSKIEIIIKSLMDTLDLSEYEVKNSQAVHKSATIEATAQLKGPMIIGPSCFVANGSLLRGGIILDCNCIVGHCGELKTSIMLEGSKIAHLNFVGDSILGCGANVEAGAIIANYRNELKNKEIFVSYKGQIVATGVQKFGAILGDNTRIGANAVIAPGTILTERSIVKRGATVDQYENTTA